MFSGTYYVQALPVCSRIEMWAETCVGQDGYLGLSGFVIYCSGPLE